MDKRKWDKESMHKLVRARVGDGLFIVVSNREPYVHTMSEGEIKHSRPVCGVRALRTAPLKLTNTPSFCNPADS